MNRKLEALKSCGVTCRGTVRIYTGYIEQETVDVEQVAEWASDRISELEKSEIEKDERIVALEEEVASLLSRIDELSQEAAQ